MKNLKLVLRFELGGWGFRVWVFLGRNVQDLGLLPPALNERLDPRPRRGMRSLLYISC